MELVGLGSNASSLLNSKLFKLFFILLTSKMEIIIIVPTYFIDPCEDLKYKDGLNSAWHMVCTY